MARWPDVEKLAVAYLSATLGKRVGTKVPSDVASLAAAGFVRVVRGPGADDGITDGPLLDVETFASTQATAADLAETTRQAMHALRGKAVGGALVDNVTTATGPVRLDWGNPAVERYVASYRLALRQR